MFNLGTVQGLLEQRDCVIEVSFAQIRKADGIQGLELTMSGVSFISDPDSLLSHGHGFGKLTQKGQGKDHIGT